MAKGLGRRGASGLAYALGVGLIALLAIGAVANLGLAGRSLFGAVGNRLANTAAVSGGGGATAAAAGCGAQTAGGYAVPALAEGGSIPVTKTVPVANGSQAYGATAACAGGGVTISGEGAGALACSGGYTASAGSCVAAPSHVSCRAIIDAGAGSANGLYMIDPDGAGGGAPMQVYCDMTGGGWTLVMMDSGAACDVPLPATSAHGWQGGALTAAAASNCGILAMTYAQSKGLNVLGHGLMTSEWGDAANAISYNDSLNRLYFSALGGIEYGNPSLAGGAYINSWVSPNGVNSGIGCPMLNNLSASQSSSHGQNMSEGSAGAGDTNYHNGGGCWGTVSTGPVVGALWVR